MFIFRNSILIVALMVGALAVQAQTNAIQPKINSPYSRFGLGDLNDQYFAASGGMAGLSAAFYDHSHINLLNPASLAQLQNTAFEVGMFGKYSKLKDGDNTDEIWSGNLNYLALAFPLKNAINEALDRSRSPWGVGMGFALLPYSNVGYDIESITTNPDYGTTSNTLKGSGGTYRIQWGTGVRYKQFSVGVNAGYQFGKLINSRLVTFDSLDNSFSTDFLDEISVSGFVLNVGVQYTHEFKKAGPNGTTVPKGERLIFGAYTSNGGNFKTNSSKLYQRVNIVDYVLLDTILQESGRRQEGTMPSEFSVGIMYEKVNKLRIGAEYSGATWSNYRNEAKPENLLDTWRVAAGVEYIPDIISYNKYSRRIRYRAGAFYSLDPRSISGEQLTRYGVTLGFGLPIILPRQQTSFVNFAIEAGQFGLTGDTGLRETYAKATIGFTLNDNTWFFKRKFN